MRGIGYDRIKRGVLLATLGASFLIPAAAAQASPPAWAPAYGYWAHAGWRGQGVEQGAQGGHSGRQGGRRGAKIAGHKIG